MLLARFSLFFFKYFILKGKKTQYSLLWKGLDIVCLHSSGGKDRKGDLQYYPFRMTPYLMKVQDAELAEEQFCCLLLAERVHSGYEGENCTVLIKHSSISPNNECSFILFTSYFWHVSDGK